MTPPTLLPPRYGRLRLDGDLDEFHHALNALAADTCQGGRCDLEAALKSMCAKHAKRAVRRADLLAGRVDRGKVVRAT